VDTQQSIKESSKQNCFICQTKIHHKFFYQTSWYQRKTLFNFIIFVFLISDMEEKDDSSSNITIIQLLDTFLNLQTERVIAYNKFHSGFKEYLESRDSQTFEKLCATIMENFS